MNTARIEAVFGYVLAVAGQADDWRSQQLGPIHLLKYLYLADLAYAQKHEGESFSGVEWRFHKFGPWSLEIYQQLEPLMAGIPAEHRVFSSKHRDDNVRWKVSSDQIETFDRRLPSEVALPVGRAVRAFGSDTSALLHHVYRTPPMLRAAPGQRLKLEPEPGDVGSSEAAAEALPEVQLSKTKIKRMRAEVQRRLAKKRKARRVIAPDPPPRYDQVFEEGVAWLDGPEPEPRAGKLTFSDDVWTSQARSDTELS